MKKPTDTTPQPRTIVEKIGGHDWYLEEKELDVFDDICLWSENPRLQPLLAGAAAAASEAELESAIQRTRGYDSLRRSIEQIGQMEPVYAWRKDADTLYLVFEGATRLAILRELARKREGGPDEGKYRKIKAKILPPHFGELERVILLARIHVRGSGVRAWGRYIEAKFIHDHVTGRNGQNPMMSVSDMARHMEKSVSWVQRLRDAYEFGRKFIEYVDAEDGEQIAVREFSVLEEISKVPQIGPKLRDYENAAHTGLRAEVFDMVKNEAFSEYRDARFLKEFHEDPDKWAQLKSGEKAIARKLAAEVKTNATGIKAKIAGLEQHIQRVLDRDTDHGLGDEDVDALSRAQALIRNHLHPGVRPFRVALKHVTTSLTEASLADVKALELPEIDALREAIDYFNQLVDRHAAPAATTSLAAGGVRA